jgi:sulfonate transport system permease protein
VSQPEVSVLAAGAAVPPSTRRLQAAAARLDTHAILSWAAPLALLSVWELLSRLGVIEPSLLPAPSTVLSTAKNLIETGELAENLWASLRRALIGFALGSTVGLSLGVLVGLFRLANVLFDRNIQMLRAVPFLAILPLVLVWFGVGELGKIFLVALASMFPLYLNTVLGIRLVDPKLLEMCRVFGLGRAELIRFAVLPGALPSILNGVRYALTTSWLALVAAESIGASAGIGVLATNAREFLQTDIMVLVIVLYALIGLASDLLARLLERRLLSWHPNYAGVRR